MLSRHPLLIFIANLASEAKCFMVGNVASRMSFAWMKIVLKFTQS